MDITHTRFVSKRLRFASPTTTLRDNPDLDRSTDLSVFVLGNNDNHVALKKMYKELLVNMVLQNGFFLFIRNLVYFQCNSTVCTNKLLVCF